MTNLVRLTLVAGAALLAASTPAVAKTGTRSADSLPAQAQLSSNASDKSQGLPNANGEKPGRGEGQGHIDGRGRGHEMGHGHGHDSDPDSPG